MNRQGKLFLIGMLVEQAAALLGIGYIMRGGAIDWASVLHLTLMGLGVGAVFLPFIHWLYRRRSRGRRMPWTTTMVFVALLAAIPLQFYFMPYASYMQGEYMRALLGLCLAFALGGPVLVASYFAARNDKAGGEKHEAK